MAVRRSCGAGDLPDPAPGAGELVVDVHAASVNAADWKMRAGSYAPVSHFPYVPGRDFSGVVAALGEGAGDFKVGDSGLRCLRRRSGGRVRGEDRDQGGDRGEEA